MITRLIMAAAMWFGITASACDDPPLHPQQETPEMNRKPTASRRPPANIEPVILAGVRFEQVLDTTGIDTEDQKRFRVDPASGDSAQE